MKTQRNPSGRDLTVCRNYVSYPINRLLDKFEYDDSVLSLLKTRKKNKHDRIEKWISTV